jgi:hypothetical protein
MLSPNDTQGWRRAVSDGFARRPRRSVQPYHRHRRFDLARAQLAAAGIKVLPGRLAQLGQHAA